MKGGREMTKKKRAEEITNGIYEAYGSDSGHLFGLKPKQREIVQVIVKFTLEYLNEKGGK